MIDLYYWPTPNGHKITLMLEEAGLDYRICPVDITAGDQMKPEFLAISPNNKMPAIVDHEPADGGAPLAVFESGAILRYLADKAGRFGGDGLRGRLVVDEWLYWQVAGLGPMSGQLTHFARYASEQIPYAIKRYTEEVQRLHGVMDRRLAAHEFLAGDYSIADMASYPWIKPFAEFLAPPANVRRWLDAIAARPATARAYDRASDAQPKAANP